MTSYTQKRHLRYRPEQLFDLVADVEAYPQFIPRLVESHIRHRHIHTVVVDMTIAIGPLRRRFSTTAVLERPHRIVIGSQDPMFEQFGLQWTFTPTADGGTEVEYHIDFSLRSRILQTIAVRLFGNFATSTMEGFMARVRQIYGTRASK